MQVWMSSEGKIHYPADAEIHDRVRGIVEGNYSSQEITERFVAAQNRIIL